MRKLLFVGTTLASFVVAGGAIATPAQSAPDQEPAADPVESVLEDLTPSSTLMAGGHAEQPEAQQQQGITGADREDLAWAMQVEDLIDRKLAEIEVMRLNGACGSVSVAFQSLWLIFEAYESSGRGERFPEFVDRLERRINEAAQRECPPAQGIEHPSEPSLEPSGVAAPPVESVLEDLTPAPVLMAGGPPAPPPRAQGMTGDDMLRVAEYFRSRDHDYNYSVYGVAGRIEVDTEAGIGFQSPAPGDEAPAGRNSDSVEMTGVGASVAPPAIGGWAFRAQIQYASGEDSRQGEIAAGGPDVGFPYSDYSPGLSTGVNIGAQAATWVTETGAESLEARLELRRGAPARWYLFTEFQRLDRNYDGAIVIDAFGSTFSQTRDQSVTDNLIGGGIGASINTGRPGRFQIGAWGEIGLFSRNTKFRAVEHNICPLCGPPDQDFFLSFAEEDNGMTWGAGAGVQVGVPLGDRVTLEVSPYDLTRGRITYRYK